MIWFFVARRRTLYSEEKEEEKKEEDYWENWDLRFGYFRELTFFVANSC